MRKGWPESCLSLGYSLLRGLANVLGLPADRHGPAWLFQTILKEPVGILEIGSSSRGCSPSDRPTASTCPEDLLKMQILRPHQGPTESKMGGWRRERIWSLIRLPVDSDACLGFTVGEMNRAGVILLYLPPQESTFYSTATPYTIHFQEVHTMYCMFQLL